MSWQTLFSCVALMFYIIAIITHFYLNWQPYGELLFYVAVWLCAVALYLELRSILKQKIKKISEIAISLVVTAIVAIHALAFLLLILFSFFVFKMITRQGCINACARILSYTQKCRAKDLKLFSLNDD